MSHKQGYGNIVIVTDSNGRSYLTPVEGYDKILGVLNDAAEYVTLHSKEPMSLVIRDLNINIHPGVSANRIISDYEKQLYKIIERESSKPKMPQM